MSAPNPDEQRWMGRALELAKTGRGTTSPNPMVGAVVVRNGQCVGEGWHQRAGGPHAERVALDAAGEKAKGADLYVTLEPCCHTGRTGPCTKAVIEAGIQRVFVGATDPNPQVSGQGIAELRAAGLEVREGLLAQECTDLNRVFNHWITTGRPFVTLKLASSLDGRIATYSGAS
ncbi:MAG: bifunctional diaminohydroxyphosphoribosylaminopyrimidine deaminase/5-amino-6-(5-phosphoribosylamino)uracil reductase RibD, partial [Myxococcota bacterium]|nr:bifunctional diaminohydroxyphosphoribosylaminopyrimidine deaminase/5-amino-6-(5-phosphoribosylamino)uracil reductase RibD [Myxococcota bacterium]